LLPKLTAEVQLQIEEIFGSEPVGRRNFVTFMPEKSRRRDVLKY